MLISQARDPTENYNLGIEMLMSLLRVGVLKN